MKRFLAALLYPLLLAGVAGAQIAPFDMSPERPPVENPAPALPQPAPQSPVELPSPGNAAQPSVPSSDATPANVVAGAYRRYLLPRPQFVLSGEIAERSWAFHVTDRQAQSPAELHLRYLNAVVVAPEASSLTVQINGVSVLAEAIEASDRARDVVAKIEAGTLRPGRNEIRISAVQRHRTDCTIQSTYELWTEVQPAGTFIAFGASEAGTLADFVDVRTLGPGPSAQPRVTILAPSLSHTNNAGDVIRLAQAIALQSNLTGYRYRIASSPAAEQDDTEILQVFLGSTDELWDIVPDLPASAASGPFAGFLPWREGEPQRLLISGTTREQWLDAIERVVAPVNRPTGMQRATLTTGEWRLPDAPMLFGGREISFADLGIRSEQFSGRRYTSSVAFGLPADFYAGAYGQARIVLDAAYSDAVLPGSLINIYVNGNVAASFPITTRRGAILDRFPIKVTMRHFKPGLNEVMLEVNLRTAQDDACLPGATADPAPRFAIFDTSSLVLPRFGRIAERPNLAGLGGTAYPYGLASQPVQVMTERTDPASLSATANIFARMALNAGRAMPLAFTGSANALRSTDAIFIGWAGGLPAGVLAQVNVDETEALQWASTQRGAPATGRAPGISVETWREQMGGGRLREWLRSVETWLSTTFNITEDMLRFLPGRDAPFVPPASAPLAVAQGLNPAGNGVWTVFAAPDQATLSTGVEGLAASDLWSLLSGQVTTLDRSLQRVEVSPVHATSFYQTQPPSLANYRLIAANWLSTNILSYSLLLVVACLVLGIATSALLSRFGRRH